MEIGKIILSMRNNPSVQERREISAVGIIRSTPFRDSFHVVIQSGICDGILKDNRRTGEKREGFMRTVHSFYSFGS
jgi:hypothetical protein